jgi:hypothetical protein
MQCPCHSHHHTLSLLPHWHQLFHVLLLATYDAIERLIFDLEVVREDREEAVVEELEAAETSL